ncbi:MAG: hypothetical protein Harvfovirus14_30 [Harvfovirus sp.]|uniref:Uncharacterized protein n=1 Tax=Harvfovirus sp. TaxID=2487768 RepID=A0A3G5A6F5_9VIRU|nr:MAG: hypothetical protein Harvfovirus14_30 [Harvfovirus sp.]
MSKNLNVYEFQYDYNYTYELQNPRELYLNKQYELIFHGGSSNFLEVRLETFLSLGENVITINYLYFFNEIPITDIIPFSTGPFNLIQDHDQFVYNGIIFEGLLPTSYIGEFRAVQLLGDIIVRLLTREGRIIAIFDRFNLGINFNY